MMAELKRLRGYTWVPVSVCVFLCLTAGLCSDPIVEPNGPPAVPKDPAPQDSSIVPVDAMLSWTCTDPEKDPVVFDVYLGPETEPPLVKSGHTSNVYDPDTLMFETRYHWKIVAKDDQGNKTSGPVWTFSTAPEVNQPPDKPWNPSPPMDYSGASVSTVLSWESSDPDGDPLTHIVLLDTVRPPEDTVAIDIENTFFDPAEDLIFNQDYYWQVIAKDTAQHETPSSVWRFTTAINNAPVVTNIDPGDGITGLNPLDVEIVWEAQDDEGDAMWFDVLLDTLNPPTAVVAESLSGDRFTPVGLLYDKTYYWRIRAHDQHGFRNGDVWDFSTRAPIQLNIVGNVPISSARGVDVAAWNPAYPITNIYVASQTEGIVAVDENLTIIDSDNFGEAFDVCAQTDGFTTTNIYVAAGDLGVRDYRDGVEWLTAGKGFNPPSGNTTGVDAYGDLVYVADNQNGLWITERTDSLEERSNFKPTPLFPVEDVSVAGDYACVVGGYHFGVVDIQDPENPSMMGFVEYSDDEVWMEMPYYVTASGQYAFISLAIDTGLWLHAVISVVDLSSPLNPQRVGDYFMSDVSPGRTEVSGDFLFVTNCDGLRVLDISDPKELKLAGYVNTGGCAAAVAVYGDYVYVADGAGGLQVIDKSPLDQ